MSEETSGEYARVLRVFEQPTLALLHRSTAAVTVTLLRLCFSAATPEQRAGQLHQRVDTLLDDLRAQGVGDLPTATGRELCQQWVNGQWLIKAPTDDGDVYSLKSSAQNALALVDSLVVDRPLLSEHRIETIRRTVRRFNGQVNVSREERIRLIEEEIAELSSTREALLAGGDLDEATPDFMLEGFAEILSLVATLPAEFRRVREAFDAMRRNTLEQFRSEDHTAGDVVSSYLRRADELSSATPEGRAFEGAFELLRDPAALMTLSKDLSDLLEHPMSELILIAEDRRRLSGIIPAINAGIEEVLTGRTRATRAIKEYVQTHDAAQDRELEATLRQLDGQLAEWLERSGERARHGVSLLPETPVLEYLPRGFADLAPRLPPPPLERVQVGEDAGAALREMLERGGPSTLVLRQVLERAVRAGDPGGPQTLGQLFASLPDDLRRPVEIFGLLDASEDLLTAMPSSNLPSQGGVTDEEYPTVRPDGSVRILHVQRIPLQSTVASPGEEPA